MPDLNHLKVDSMPAAFAELGRKHNELVELIASIEAATGIDIKMTQSPAKKLSVPGTPGTVSRQPRGRIRIGLVGVSSRGGSGSTGTAQCIGPDGYLISGISGTNTTNYPHNIRVNSNVGNAYAQITNTTIVSSDGNPNANYTIINNASVQAIGINGNSVGIYGRESKVVAYDGTHQSIVNANGYALLDPTGNYTYRATNGSAIIRSEAFAGTGPNTSQILAGSIYSSFGGVNYIAHNTEGFLVGAGVTAVRIDYANITRPMSIKTINVCVNGNAKNMLILASEPF